jgi:hypothetical protein
MLCCPQMGLMTRTSLPAEKHNGIKSGIKETSKAMTYYGKKAQKNGIPLMLSGRYHKTWALLWRSE